MKLNTISTFILAAFFFLEILGVFKEVTPEVEMKVQVSTYEGTVMVTPFLNIGPLDGTKVLIDWGDGQNEKIASLQGFASHKFTKGGTYPVSVTVKTKGGYKFLASGDILVSTESMQGSVDLIEGEQVSKGLSFFR